jgi:hypothetical protein
MYIVAEGSSDMAEKKRDYSLNASLYSRPRKTAAEIAELKKRANKRKMLVSRMEGLRKEGAHWDKYIKKTERKRKATKVIKTTAEIAELAAGIPAIAKVVGKRVIRKGIEKASKKAVKITQDSKFAKRTADAAIKEIKEKGKKQRGVLVEKTTVKGGKATTPKLPKGAGGRHRARRSLPRSPNQPAGDAGKRVAKREEYYKLREHLKKRAEKQKKLDKFLEGSGAPKTSAKPKRHTWKDPDLQYMVDDINRKRSLPTRIEPEFDFGKNMSPKEIKKWQKILGKTPVPKRKKPGSGGKGRK